MLCLRLFSESASSFGQGSIVGSGPGCCGCRGRQGLGTGHLRGCWICCVLGETCLSMEACGFWWATCAAAGGKSLSPRAITPEMYTVGLGGLVLSHSCSSLSFSSFPSPVCGCFCTIRIPPAFTAGGCPALVSSFPSGGEDMAPLARGATTAAAEGWAAVRARGPGGKEGVGRARLGDAHCRLGRGRGSGRLRGTATPTRAGRAAPPCTTLAEWCVRSGQRHVYLLAASRAE